MSKNSDGFKPPESFLRASQSRLAKVKLAQESRKAKESPKDDETLSLPNYESNTKPIPIPVKKQASGSYHSSVESDGLNVSRSRSNSFTSKAVLEVEKIKAQREERRQRQAEIRKLKSEMDTQEQQQMVYRQEIDKFRLEFAKNAASLRIRTNKLEMKRVDPKIKVCVRKRPLNNKEAMRSNFDIVTTATNGYPYAHVYLHEPKVKLDMGLHIHTHKFQFDYVFDENSTNEQIYREVAEPLVDVFLSGGRATLFAYGQTGSGKTHTIFGSPEEKGVYESVCSKIISSTSKDSVLSLCFVEIYGAYVFDLLAKREKIAILEDANGYAQIHGQREVKITDLDQLMQLIQTGIMTRTTGTTEANSQSSRSHAIVQISQKDMFGKLTSKFSLVDLAGSERGADTGDITRNARREGSEINKSLLALKECIRALYVQKTGGEVHHVPFRASKLTQILRDSFTGKKARTAMIAMISPGSLSAEHTLNTLRYADRVKELKTKVIEGENEFQSPTEDQIEISDDIDITLIDDFNESQYAESFMSDSMSKADSLPNSIYKPNGIASLKSLEGGLEVKPALDSSSSAPTKITKSFTVQHSKEELVEEVEEIIELHVASAVKTSQIARIERGLILEASELDHDMKKYLSESIKNIDAKIKLWTEVADRMKTLHQKLK